MDITTAISFTGSLNSLCCRLETLQVCKCVGGYL